MGWGGVRVAASAPFAGRSRTRRLSRVEEVATPLKSLTIVPRTVLLKKIPTTSHRIAAEMAAASSLAGDLFLETFSNPRAKRPTF